MKIGYILLRRGQRYVYRGERGHWTRDGRHITLLAFESRCAECGAPFECLTSKSAMRLGLNRRCKRHQAPGVPVQKRTAKRVPQPKRAAKPVAKPQRWDGTAPRPWLTEPPALQPAYLD